MPIRMTANVMTFLNHSAHQIRHFFGMHSEHKKRCVCSVGTKQIEQLWCNYTIGTIIVSKSQKPISCELLAHSGHVKLAPKPWGEVDRGCCKPKAARKSQHGLHTALIHT